MNIEWQVETREKFEKLIGKVPVFLKDMAKEKISARAQKIVLEDNRQVIEEKDMVDACFAETPFGFHGPMKVDMEAIGIDYTRYGYKR